MYKIKHCNKLVIDEAMTEQLCKIIPNLDKLVQGGVLNTFNSQVKPPYVRLAPV